MTENPEELEYEHEEPWPNWECDMGRCLHYECVLERDGDLGDGGLESRHA
ncbi:hypothetical protein H4W27_001410 [Nesterenkonia lutea]|uniref:Uncharacterized protein n=1 Tax=Nesterenkonia lutea TaxID=272919 RepID=A0ABR9JFQ6_9MICC|nr:hypothetical protein [Nesterenkonia lutea]